MVFWRKKGDFTEGVTSGRRMALTAFAQGFLVLVLVIGVKFTDFVTRAEATNYIEEFAAVVNQSACGAGWSYYITPDGLGDYEFNQPCVVHDECYTICGSDKQVCDTNFRSSIKAECNKRGDGTSPGYCEIVPDIYYFFVNTMGDEAFEQSQNSCVELPAV